MAAMAVGLREAVTDEYLETRIGQVERLGERLREAGVPIYTPVGGHAVYVDAGRALADVPVKAFPGQTFVCELYREGGVRGVELGSFAFPGADRPELVRLALPRRTYHDEHLEHVVESAKAVLDRGVTDGLEIVSEPDNETLRHFSAELRPRSLTGRFRSSRHTRRPPRYPKCESAYDRMAEPVRRRTPSLA